MNNTKKKWPWILLISIFTTILIVDIIFWCLSSGSGSRPDFGGSGGSRPEMSTSEDGTPQMPEGFDSSKMPEGFDSSKMPEAFDGSNPPEGFDSSKIPEGFDGSNFPEGFDKSKRPGRSDDSSSSDGTGDQDVTGDKDVTGESGDGDSSSRSGRGRFPGGFSRNSNSFFNKLRSFYLPVMIVCIVMDIFAIIMLIRAIRHNKNNGGSDPDGGDTDSGNGNDEMMTPVRKAVPKKVIGLIVVTLVAALSITLVILTNRKQASVGTVQADESIVEASLQEASMSQIVTAGGSVSEESSVEDYYPSGIETTKFYVSEGDTVSAGDPIADVDRVSVMNTIKNIQDVIGTVDEKLESISDERSAELSVTAAGRVKKIFASEGQTVVDVVQKEGALMLISLDGTMAVDIETEEKADIGEQLEVTLASETVSGRVSAISEGLVTVTIDDSYGAYGESVSVARDGKTLGKGELYIHQPLAVTGYEGVVEEIVVAEEDELEKGDCVIQLTDEVYSAEYEKLLKQREKLQEQMKSLFELYQSGVILAKTSGTVASLNDSLETVSDLGTGARAVQMSNSPTGEDDSGYVNYAVLVTAVKDKELQVKMSANPIGDIDLTAVAEIGAAICTNAGKVQKSEIGTVYGYDGSAWIQQTVDDIKKGEILVASFDSEGKLVWIVRNAKSAATETPDTPSGKDQKPGTDDPTGEGKKPTTDDPTGDGKEPSTEDPTGEGKKQTTDDPTGDSKKPTTDDPTGDGKKPTTDDPTGEGKEPSTEDPTGEGKKPATDDPTGEGEPSTDIPTQRPTDGQGTSSSGTGTGQGMPGAFTRDTGSDSSFDQVPEMTTEKEEEPVYAVAEVSVISITPTDTVDITVTVDELDISDIFIGQECEVTFDAISAKSYTGTVKSIGTGDESEGGNTKYTVTVTLKREADMLSGMNAHITFSFGEKSDARVIPESALYEEDGKVYVYTSYDSEKDELSGKKEVTTGLADGENVEILSGLDENEKIYYRYADSLMISSR